MDGYATMKNFRVVSFLLLLVIVKHVLLGVVWVLDTINAAIRSIKEK